VDQRRDPLLEQSVVNRAHKELGKVAIAAHGHRVPIARDHRVEPVEGVGREVMTRVTGP